MGTKNNPKNRVKAAAKKQFDGKDVDPAYYCGTHAGHGKYMAAKFSGTLTLVVTADGKPVQWNEIK
ncbi:MAG: hypothetical protein KA100_05530 [Rickettsiales bacterium]|nr:hypothetical protein [Rickettsiales bacterium]